MEGFYKKEGGGEEFSSVRFSHSVVSDSLQPHGLQYTRLPCPSPTPRACSNSCSSSLWCHSTISVVPFSFCLQSFPASGSFPVSQFFTWGGQSIGVSASTSVLPMNTQNWSPSGWTGWISLQSKGLSRVFSNTTVQKYQFFNTQLFAFYLLLTLYLFKTIEMMLDKNQIQTIFLLKFKAGHKPADNSQHQQCIWPRNC